MSEDTRGQISSLYEKAGISTDPEARRNYLRTFLGITPTEEGLISSFSGKGDPVSRLKILENMAASELKECKTH